MTEKSYHQRFRERFGTFSFFNRNSEDILAFIDGEKEESFAEGYADGRNETRASLIEKVEKVRSQKHWIRPALCGGCQYNQALDDILTYLRGGKKETTEEESCRLVDEAIREGYETPRPESPKSHSVTGKAMLTGFHTLPDEKWHESPKETECCEKCLYNPNVDDGCPCHKPKEECCPKCRFLGVVDHGLSHCPCHEPGGH